MARLKSLLKRLLSRIFPENLVAQMVFEARILVKLVGKRRTLARKYGKLNALRLNIGCGANTVPGWINLDLHDHPTVDFWDCRKGLPFIRDGAVAAIFAEHFIEHLEYRCEVEHFLRECRRCLSPSGVLRIVVPDAGEYLKLYGKDDWNGMARIRPLIKDGDYYCDYWFRDRYLTKMQLINAVFRQKGEHKYAYDAETLIELLRSVGFLKINELGFGQSDHEGVCLDTRERRFESLYIEATD